MIVLQDINDPQVATLLLQGAVGVVPTDTIYGLVASAHNPHAVARLYALKDRERKPGTVIAASADQLIELGVDQAIIRKIAHLWPNPLSIEVPIGEPLAHLHQGTGHGAFRVAADEIVRALLMQTGPLLTTSVNHPGAPPAMSLAESQAYFGSAVDFYVDGGTHTNRPPSTVVRWQPDGSFELIRQGAVTIDIKRDSV